MAGAAAETVLLPWGMIAGSRIDGAWLDYEASVRLVEPSAGTLQTAVKYVRKPEYSAEGARRSVRSRIGTRGFRLEVEDATDERAVVDLELEPRGATDPGEAFFCVDLTSPRFAGGRVELESETGRVMGDFTWDSIRRRSPRWTDDARARVVRIVGSGVQLEVRPSMPLGVVLRRDAVEYPLSGNDPRETQRLLEGTDAGVPAGQLYFRLPDSDGVAGETNRVRFEWRVRTRSSRISEAVRMSLDTSKPGRAWDGIGGNFRLQFPDTDPAVIGHNLEHLPVAWGRVELPWSAWDPEEAGSGLDLARQGQMAASVVNAMGMARDLHARGVPVMLAAWSPPRWARDPKPQPVGARGTALDESKLPRICRSLADYCAHLQQAFGVRAAYFSFNEPETGVEVRQTAAEHARFLVAMGDELERRGLDTRLFAGDTAHGTAAALAYLDPILADPAARRRVGAVAFHTWRGCTPEVLRRWDATARDLGVPLFVTEGGPDAHLHEYPSVRLEPWFALQSAELYVRLCAYAQPAAILEWQLTTDYSVLRGGGVYGETGPLEPTQRFWNLRQLAATPTGSRAMPMSVEGSTEARSELTAAAFVEPTSGRAVVHVVNRGAARRVEIAGWAPGLRNVRAWVTDDRRGMREWRGVRMRSGRVSLELPAGSFVTVAASARE